MKNTVYTMYNLGMPAVRHRHVHKNQWHQNLSTHHVPLVSFHTIVEFLVPRTRRDTLRRQKVSQALEPIMIVGLFV